jgi:hypothetical protein
MSIQIALGFIVLTTDAIISRLIADDPSSISFQDSIKAFISAAVWIPYLNISERVKDTFVTRLDDEEGDNAEIVEEAEVRESV